MAGTAFEDEEAEASSPSLQGLDFWVRFLRRGRSGPKGPLIENSGVNRLRVEGHLGP